MTGLGKGAPETRVLRSRVGDSVKAVFVPFCDRIADLLSAADLVVSRAGAGTLAELIRCEVPAILVPYPFAASDHQRANAAFFERQGGGIVIEEAMVGDLHSEVLDLVFNEWLLRQLRGNLKRMDRVNSLDLMVADLEAMARSGSGGRMGRSRKSPHEAGDATSSLRAGSKADPLSWRRRHGRGAARHLSRPFRLVGFR